MSAARPGEIERPQEPDRLGHPLSAGPVWTARTAGNGVAEIHGLPRGSYLLNVFHDFFVPRSMVAVGGERITPPADMNIEMTEAWAAVAVMPIPEPPRHYTWNVDRGALALPVPAQARIGTIRASLQRRFPDAMVFVAIKNTNLDADATVAVECQALTDNLAYGARWQLQPAHSIEPVFLEPRPDTRMGSVRIEVRDRDGRLMPMDLRVLGSGVRSDLHAPGELLLPFGDYRLAPFYSPAWLADAFDGAGFHVGESSPPGGLVTVVMPEPLCLVRIAPKIDGKSLSVIHIAIKDPRGRNHGMMNLDPGAGPWDVWVPRAKIRIQVQSAAYREVLRELDVGPTDATAAVELPLEPRESR